MEQNISYSMGKEGASNLVSLLSESLEPVVYMHNNDCVICSCVLSIHIPVADPEVNRGGGVLEARRAEWGGYGRGPLPLVGVLGASPEKILKKWCKMVQSGVQIKSFKLT